VQLLILLAFLSSTFIFAVNLWFSVSGAYMVFLTIIILVYLIFFYKKSFSINKSEITSVLIVVLFIFTIFSFTNNIIDINGELSKAMWVNRFCMFVASILTISYFVKKNGHNVSFLLKNRFFLIIAVSLVIQLTLLRVEKVPQIDVFDVLRWGPEQLLSGKNPYETAATVPGLSDSDFKYRHFAYGPAAIYLFLPFDAILKEPRYLLIIANFLTAFSLYVIGKNCWRDKKIGEIFALIYLFNPRLVYFLSFSWTDGLIVSLIALGAFSLHKKREGGFATSLGLISSIKIFYILPLLFFLKYKPLSKIKVLTLWFIFTAILHLPFLVNNWQAMYKSIIEINTGGEFFAQLQRFSLTFATLIDRQFHIYPPKSFFPIAATVITIFYWLVFKSTIDVSRLFLSVALVFIVLIFFGPIANASYYFTASSLVLFALAFSGVKIKNG